MTERLDGPFKRRSVLGMTSEPAGSEAHVAEDQDVDRHCAETLAEVINAETDIEAIRIFLESK